MLKKAVLLLLAMSLAGCVSSTSDPAPKAPAFSSDETATVLVTIGEGWAFQSGQAFAILTGNGQSTSLKSMTDRRGGPGSADLVVGRNKAYEFNAVSVNPGRYAITDWGFRMRRGNATNRQTRAVTLEAGKTYYLGSFYGNNFVQTAKISDKWATERANYQSKFPDLDVGSVTNASSAFRMECWKMDITDELGLNSPAIRKSLENCR